MWTAIILICTAASFGVIKDDKQQCAYGAPGMVSAHRVRGDVKTVAECHDKASKAVGGYRSKAVNGNITTWQCMTPEAAGSIK